MRHTHQHVSVCVCCTHEGRRRVYLRRHLVCECQHRSRHHPAPHNLRCKLLIMPGDLHTQGEQMYQSVQCESDICMVWVS